MFFYVSFLRPPPTLAKLGQPVLITPQVSNDLRTEPCQTDQDIYYDWVLAESSGKRPLQGSTKKLMTWKNANAYKEVPVPLPHGAREGQSWRLVLCAAPVTPVNPPSGTPASVRTPLARVGLNDERIGMWHAFPVASMPVTFTNKWWDAKAASKQEQIERVYEFEVGWEMDPLGLATSSVVEKDALVDSGSAGAGVEGVTTKPNSLQVNGDKKAMPKVVTMLIREHTSFDLDKKIWDSGIGLSAWLVQWLDRRFAELPTPKQGVQATPSGLLKSILGSPNPLRVLELGAGVGITALVLAALRSRIADAEDSILTTDLESALPLLQHNIDVNRGTRSAKMSLRCSVLDWDQKVSEQLSHPAGFDLVMMADVTYNTDSFSALVRTLADIRDLDPSKEPCFLMAYKERDEEERKLWEMAKAVSITFVQVGSIPGHNSEEAPIEIWMG